jgi:hypothetical protein
VTAAARSVTGVPPDDPAEGGSLGPGIARIGRRAFLAAALFASPACSSAQQSAISVASPLALPEQFEAGGLRLLGGLEIDRSRLGFGGLSGLHISPDLSVTVVSDLGHFAEARLVLGSGRRPLDLQLIRAGRLGDGAGRPLARGHAADAEALARLPNGDWLVAFERWHRIRLYRDLAGPGRYVEAPPGLERGPANAGLESLAILPDGRWLALTEEMALPEVAGAYAGWIGHPGAWRPIGWRPAPGMVAVDAAPLPNGGALVLERGFSFFGGFSGRLTRLSPAELADPAAGAILEGTELLRFAPPLPVDNFEGVTAFRHDGHSLVGLVTDDNENRLQRSLLLLAELRD